MSSVFDRVMDGKAVYDCYLGLLSSQMHRVCPNNSDFASTMHKVWQRLKISLYSIRSKWTYLEKKCGIILYVSPFQFTWTYQCDRSSQCRHSNFSFYVRYRKFSLSIVLGALLQFVVDAQIKPTNLCDLEQQKGYCLSVCRRQVKTWSINCTVFKGTRKGTSNISIVALDKLINSLSYHGIFLYIHLVFLVGLLISAFNVQFWRTMIFSYGIPDYLMLYWKPLYCHLSK